VLLFAKEKRQYILVEPTTCNNCKISYAAEFVEVMLFILQCRI